MLLLYNKNSLAGKSARLFLEKLAKAKGPDKPPPRRNQLLSYRNIGCFPRAKRKQHNFDCQSCCPPKYRSGSRYSTDQSVCSSKSFRSQQPRKTPLRDRRCLSRNTFQPRCRLGAYRIDAWRLWLFHAQSSAKPKR